MLIFKQLNFILGGVGGFGGSQSQAQAQSQSVNINLGGGGIGGGPGFYGGGGKVLRKFLVKNVGLRRFLLKGPGFYGGGPGFHGGRGENLIFELNILN